MAAQALFADTVGLANRPVPPNAVQWSEDGVLAVAAAHSVVLLSPGDLQGPRAFASPGNMCEPGLLQAAGQPVNPTADAHHEVAHLRVAAMVSQYPALQAGLTARSVAWSPAGCAQAGGCLLAVVASDHQVLVYGPPPGPQNEWQQVADLSQQLLEHSEETGWRDAEQDAGAAAPAGTTQDAAAGGADGNVLRLRGGGKRKRPSEKRAAQPPAQAEEAAPAGAAGAEAEGAFEPAVGQAVEVMSIDEGLAGCWFTGTIQELYRGWALVAYDELKEAEEEGSAALKEWFAVPGQRQGKAPPAKPPGAVHGAASGALLRPAPPLQDLEAGRARAPGEVCDCLIEGGWWELCKVVDAPSQAKGSGSGSESGCQVVLEWGSERERHTATLVDCRNTLRFADGRWELWHGPVPAEASTDAAAAAAAASSSQEAAPQPPEQQRQQQEQVVGGADGGSGEAGSPAKKRRPRKPSAGRKAAAGDGEAVQEEPAAAAAAAAAEAEAEAAEPPNKRRKGGRGPSSSSKNQPASAGGKPGADLAMAAAAVAADAFLSGASSAAGKGKRASTAGGGAASAKQKTPAKAAVAAYEVPADFDASVLPSVDLSGAKEARASLPLAFCRRFLALRREVPQEELPTYPYTSSHLKGRDAELVAQVVAELLHAHGPALAAVAPPLADAKWLNTDGRQKLNKVWDRTCNRLLGKFTIAEGEAPEEEPEEADGALYNTTAVDGAA